MNIFKRFQVIYNAINEKVILGPDENEIGDVVERTDVKELMNSSYREKIKNEFIDLNQHKLNALCEIGDYIMSFNWITNVSAKTLQRVKYFINNKYSYKHTQSKFGDELNAIQVCIHRAGIALEKKIGSNTISLIERAKTKEEIDIIMGTFNSQINFGKTSQLLIKEVSQLMPIAKRSQDSECWDCLKEINFLKKYSSVYMNKYIKSLSNERIAQVLYVLESNDIYYKEEKVLFHDFLRGRVSFEELKARISEVKDTKECKG